MNHDPDRYVVPARRAEVELVEKRSRFLAVASHTPDAADAQDLLESLRRRFHDAAHHCFAWRIGGHERYSDDGEPAGTAGKPILAAIDHSGLVSVTVVVSRYFGGVKLGPGGLVRAYGDSAREVLDRAGREERFRTGRVAVTFDFELTSPVHHAIQKFEAVTVTQTYSERTRLLLELRASRLQAFRAALLDATAGRADIQDE